MTVVAALPARTFIRSIERMLTSNVNYIITEGTILRKNIRRGPWTGDDMIQKPLFCDCMRERCEGSEDDQRLCFDSQYSRCREIANGKAIVHVY
jgi:hypothetical protein